MFSYLRFQHHEDDLGLLSVLVNYRSCNLVHFVFLFVIGVTPEGCQNDTRMTALGKNIRMKVLNNK